MSASPANADVTGQIEVRLRIEPGCEISSRRAGPGAGLAHESGILDFGTVPPAWNGALGTRLSQSGSSGAIEVMCSPDVESFNIAIDGGLRGNRTLMRMGGDASNTANIVAYNVFSDPARTDEFIANSSRTYLVSGNGQPVPIPVFGKIAPNYTAKNGGLFTDTLLITIDL